MPESAPSPARVVMEVAHRSDPGRDPDKQINEDSCAYAEVPMGHLLVVCDGMGGHMSGREASMRAVHTILHDMSQAQPGSASPCMALKSSIEHAGRVVFDLGGPGQNLLRPGSTCVALLVHTAGVDPAHVGDSRAYLVRGGQVTAITRDHSMVRQMVDAGVLSEEDAMRHPDANKITRALGMQPTVEVEVRATPLPIERGDIFLLCSDGLSDLVLPNEMLAVIQHALRAGGLDHACEQLVALANHRGGHDNITVVLGRVVEAPEMRAAPVTVIGSPDPSSMAPPMTVPDLRAIPNLPGGRDGSGLHPTVVDDGSAQTMAQGALASGTAHPSPVPARDSEEDADDDGARRRRLWISVGAVLVVLGLLLVIASVWWAFSAGSSRFDDTRLRNRVACVPTQHDLPSPGELPACRHLVEQTCFPLTLRVDS